MTIPMIGLVFYLFMCGVFYWIWAGMELPWYLTALMAVAWPITLVVFVIIIKLDGDPWLDKEDK